MSTYVRLTSTRKKLTIIGMNEFNNRVCFVAMRFTLINTIMIIPIVQWEPRNVKDVSFRATHSLMTKIVLKNFRDLMIPPNEPPFPRRLR